MFIRDIYFVAMFFFWYNIFNRILSKIDFGKFAIITNCFERRKKILELIIDPMLSVIDLHMITGFDGLVKLNSSIGISIYNWYANG